MEAKAKGVVNLLSESSATDEDRIIQVYYSPPPPPPAAPPPFNEPKEVGEQLIVKVKTPTHGSLDGEREEMILEVDAVCKFCFDIFGADNVLKTKCSCKFTLIHEECATELSRKQGNIKCTVCEQDVQNIPVTLSRANDIQSTSPSSTTKRPRNCFASCFGT